ncbi:MAG: NnrS family protein [Kiloniellales bacterium]
MALAALANLARLARWQGHRTLAEPLVWVLHVGFLWLPIGFGLMALVTLVPAITPSAALHALTGGAIATMILAVSTRATLGHTGRDLHADLRTTLIYILVVVSAVARITAGLFAGGYLSLLMLAGAAWLAAFGLFLVVYGPMLLRPRPAK